MTRLPSTFAVSLIVMTIITACDQLPLTQSGATDDAVVATINGKQIHQSDVDLLNEGMPDQYRQVPAGYMQDQLVNQLIDRELMVSAAKAAGLGETEDFRKQMVAMEGDLLMQSYVVMEIETQLTDARLRTAYDNMVQAFESVPERKARHILVATEEEAIDLIAELDEGADFATLAKEYSTGPSGPNGGELDYFNADYMVKPFSDAAFALELGSYTPEPVQTQFGWHIILVEAARQSEPQSFEEAEAGIRVAEGTKIYREITAQLRAKATIEMPELAAAPGADELTE